MMSRLIEKRYGKAGLGMIARDSLLFFVSVRDELGM